MDNTDIQNYLVRFVLPILSAVMLSLVGLGFFGFWSAEQVDTDALEREKRLIKRSLDEQAHQLSLTLEEFGVWDEAVHAYREGDTSWLTDNVATGLYEYNQPNLILMYNSDLSPLLAMRNGVRLSPKTASLYQQTLMPLFKQLRSRDSTTMISAYHAGTQVVAPTLSSILMLDDAPALVGLIPLLPYTEKPLPVGSEPILVAAMNLDAGLASYLGDQYLIDGVQFSATPPDQSVRAALPIMGPTGEPIAWTQWTPSLPGTDLLGRAMPGLLLGSVIILLTMAMLLRSLRATLGQLQKARKDAEYKALHDPLTMVGNRYLFHKRLEEGLAALEGTEPSLALIALDLDHFKTVNDTQGHDAGDELLRQVTRRISACLDVDDTLARLGGDEFAIIQCQLSSIADATDLAKRIIDAVSEPFILPGYTARIGVSVGIATAPDMSIDGDELSRMADEALYRAKSGGRNRYCIHAPANHMPAPAEQRALLREVFNGAESA